MLPFKAAESRAVFVKRLAASVFPVTTLVWIRKQESNAMHVRVESE